MKTHLTQLYICEYEKPTDECVCEPCQTRRLVEWAMEHGTGFWALLRSTRT